MKENILKRFERLFDDWGYTKEITTYKCLFEDSLLVPYIDEQDGEYEFSVSTKDMQFHHHLFEKGKIKTLLLFFQENCVYYEFLQDLEHEGLVDMEDKVAYISKDNLRKIDFNKAN